jgi:hypothetical protein
MIFFNRKSEPIDVISWAHLRGNMQYCRIAEDDIGNIYISTVWVGVRMSPFDDSPPRIFETMVFNLGADEEYIQQYSTEEAARIGHAAAVNYAKERQSPALSAFKGIIAAAIAQHQIQLRT